MCVIVYIFRQDEGLIKALEVLSEGDEIEEEGRFLTNCATSVLNCLRKLQSFPSIFSWVPVSENKLILYILILLQINYQDVCEEYAAVSLWYVSMTFKCTCWPFLELIVFIFVSTCCTTLVKQTFTYKITVYYHDYYINHSYFPLGLVPVLRGLPSTRTYHSLLWLLKYVVVCLLLSTITSLY